MNQVPGPLPLFASFVKQRADTILLATFSGSAFSNLQFAAPSVIELNIDDRAVGSTQLFINNAGEHLAYPTQQVVIKGISAVLAHGVPDRHRHRRRKRPLLGPDPGGRGRRVGRGPSAPKPGLYPTFRLTRRRRRLE